MVDMGDDREIADQRERRVGHERSNRRKWGKSQPSSWRQLFTSVLSQRR
jgi:hypothetical protein